MARDVVYSNVEKKPKKKGGGEFGDFLCVCFFHTWIWSPDVK